ncbi:phosphate propanoyltransferase [Oscillospiraceae bacterium OttesenSCG-928-G22]|nr:phosphate propanoyltransferase [Oscillospiraceae bacterium OttesenSCG-928-G22]
MDKPTIIIESSARHVHVTKEDLHRLFGDGYELTNKRELSQPGQYLTEEKVRLEGPKGAIDRVSILGPERPATQVEISFTDARVLGVTAPVRESGDIGGSSPVKLVGPAGSVELSEGCIVAKRHLHITPEDAASFGVADKEIIQVAVAGERALIFDEVVVRVSEKFQTRMHIDYDEANAAMLGPDATGCIIKK